MGSWEFRYSSPYNPSPIGDAGWRPGELWVLLAANLTSSSVKKKPLSQESKWESWKNEISMSSAHAHTGVHVYIHSNTYTILHTLVPSNIYHRGREKDRQRRGGAKVLCAESDKRPWEQEQTVKSEHSRRSCGAGMKDKPKRQATIKSWKSVFAEECKHNHKQVLEATERFTIIERQNQI